MKVTINLPMPAPMPPLPGLFKHKASNAVYLLTLLSSQNSPPPLLPPSGPNNYRGILIHKGGSGHSAGHCIEIYNLADFELYHGSITLENGS